MDPRCFLMGKYCESTTVVDLWFRINQGWTCFRRWNGCLNKHFTVISQSQWKNLFGQAELPACFIDVLKSHNTIIKVSHRQIKLADQARSVTFPLTPLNHAEGELGNPPELRDNRLRGVCAATQPTPWRTRGPISCCGCILEFNVICPDSSKQKVLFMQPTERPANVALIRVAHVWARGYVTRWVKHSACFWCCKIHSCHKFNSNLETTKLQEWMFGMVMKVFSF